MKKVIKVLHIGEYVQGGVATYINTLIKYSPPKFENYLILSNEKSKHDWPLEKDRVIYYKYKRSWESIIPAIKIIQETINKIKPDIIYVHSTWAGVMARLPYLIKKRNAKIIYNSHGWSFLMDIPKYKKCIYALIERVLANATDVIINVSKYEYNAALQVNITPNKLMQINSGISQEIKADFEEVNMPINKLNILFVGRFDKQKGVDILLDSFKKCTRKDIHLTMIGGSVLNEDMQIYKNEDDRITFMGWVPHEKLGSYYKNCDVVVMPSRWEAFGLVAIESMKYGKPVIVSNRGALPEIIHNNENGFVFDMDDSNSLKMILQDLDKMECLKMSESIKYIFKEKFTVDNMVNKTYRVYNMIYK